MQEVIIRDLLKNLSSLSVKDICAWAQIEKSHKRKILMNLKEIKLISEKPSYSELLKVVPDSVLSTISFDTDGWVKYDQSVVNHLMSASVGRTRAYAEHNNRYRQLVGVAIFVAYNDNSERVFGLLEKCTGYNEEELIGTIGTVSGHISMVDQSIQAGLIREVFEEIRGFDLLNVSSIENLGFIREISGTVSDEHLACVTLIDFKTKLELISLSSTSPSEIFRWYTEKEILELCSNEKMLDSWTSLAIQQTLSHFKQKAMIRKA